MIRLRFSGATGCQLVCWASQLYRQRPPDVDTTLDILHGDAQYQFMQIISSPGSEVVISQRIRILSSLSVRNIANLLEKQFCIARVGIFTMRWFIWLPRIYYELRWTVQTRTDYKLKHFRQSTVIPSPAVRNLAERRPQVRELWTKTQIGAVLALASIKFTSR